jgi:hypothetical protein
MSVNGSNHLLDHLLSPPPPSIYAAVLVSLLQAEQPPPLITPSLPGLKSFMDPLPFPIANTRTDNFTKTSTRNFHFRDLFKFRSELILQEVVEVFGFDKFFSSSLFQRVS